MATRNALNRSVNKHQTNLQRVNILAQKETRNVLSVLPNMSFNEQASYVRNIIPTVINKYGNVAASVGALHYNEMRSLQTVEYGLKPYVATVPIGISFKDKIDNMLGFSIAKNSDSGIKAMAAFLIDELTLYVANYDRETISFNANNEPKTVQIQRVAEADACAFCSTIAAAGVVYEGIAWDEDVVTYANDYHSNCNCSTEVIYSNSAGKFDSNIRPDYYDTLESQYKSAQDAQAAIRADIVDKHLNEFNGSYSKLFKAYPEAATTTKNVTAQMRLVSGRS
jgi:hypothetical protein